MPENENSLLLNREFIALRSKFFPTAVGEQEEKGQVFLQHKARFYELLLGIENALLPSNIDVYLNDIKIFDSAVKTCFPETHQLVKAELIFLVRAKQTIDTICMAMMDYKNSLVSQYKWLGSVFLRQLLAGSSVASALGTAQTSLPERYTISLNLITDNLLEKYQQLQQKATELRVTGVLSDIVNDVVKTQTQSHQGNDETGSQYDQIASSGLSSVCNTVYLSWRSLENLVKNCHLTADTQQRLEKLADVLRKLVPTLSSVVFDAETESEYHVIKYLMNQIIYKPYNCLYAGCETRGKRDLLFFSAITQMRNYLLRTLLRDAIDKNVMTAYQQWRQKSEVRPSGVAPRVHWKLIRLKQVLWIYINDVYEQLLHKGQRWPNDLLPEMEDETVKHFFTGVCCYPHWPHP